jgi:hypothetical protein
MVLEEVTNDSQKYTHPVEMLMGKKLKPEVWKTMIQTTAIQTLYKLYSVSLSKATS